MTRACRRNERYLRTTLALVFRVAALGGFILVAPIACDASGGQCGNDGDCDPGSVCRVGLFGGMCKLACSRHEDCPAGSQCSGCSNNGCMRGVCDPGCRTSAECPDTQWCNSGVCALGCSSNDQCALGRPNSACMRTESRGECRTTCANADDCARSAHHKQCICGMCATACSETGSCGEGQVCQVSSGCLERHCMAP